MLTRELFGLEVLDVNANRIGRVMEVDVDMIQGLVNNMVVKAGLMKKYHIGLDKIDKLGDRIVLNVPEEALK